ncbi:MAG: UDP-2,3-diacylglucosamine diphosphatase LpxI [Rickettsiaceae bacterium]|nr:UDP-2,3-diacylglucosamine diphosphatase LpxI [Rickettsiaceae bacterium]MDP5083170.1 UDP-2,3-diacylglucosamine diphosphatase LpxI [Rickettsiaceae bacterium]
MLPKLGIIAGNGDLPEEIAKLQKASGGDCVIAALESKANFANFAHKHFALGAVGSIIEYFKENSVENVVIIGGIGRPDLKSLKVDFSGSLLLAKILKQKILGDDNILKIVSNYIESKSLKVVFPQEILKLGKYNLEIASTKSPSAQDKTDIEIGKQVIASLGALDVGQSVIVCDGYVVGIEAAEGTDNLIRRCEILRRAAKGGVLVKMSKATQDMRLDVPVIGPDTIFFLAKHGFNGVAIEKESVIVVKPEETMRLLDDNGLFLKVLD